MDVVLQLTEVKSLLKIDQDGYMNTHGSHQAAAERLINAVAENISSGKSIHISIAPTTNVIDIHQR